jgi:hypothetical protein
MSAIPLYQQFTGTFENNYGGLAQVDGLGFSTGEEADEGGGMERQERLAGPIGEKNRYAQVMLVLVPIGLYCALRARSRGAKLVWLACSASIALGFVLAFSRGGAMGMLCMVAMAIGMGLIDLRKALLVAAGMGLLLVAVPQYWTRLETLGTTVQLFDEDKGTAASDGAVRRRVTEMMAAVRVFLDHPSIGVGPGMFKAYSEEYGNQDALRRIEGGRRAHSLYLEFAAENGAVGLGLLLAALAMTLVGLAGARRANLGSDPEMADLATTYLLALVCYLSTGVFLHLSYMRYFYLVVALGGAVAHVGFQARPSARARRSPRPRGAPGRAGPVVMARPSTSTSGASSACAVDAGPREVAAVSRQLGPIRAALAREPDVTVRFVERIERSSPLRYIGLSDAAFSDDAFLLLRGKHESRLCVQIPFERVGERCEILCERGLAAGPCWCRSQRHPARAGAAAQLPVHEGAAWSRPAGRRAARPDALASWRGARGTWRTSGSTSRPGRACSGSPNRSGSGAGTRSLPELRFTACAARAPSCCPVEGACAGDGGESGAPASRPHACTWPS